MRCLLWNENEDKIADSQRREKELWYWTLILREETPGLTAVAKFMRRISPSRRP